MRSALRTTLPDDAPSSSPSCEAPAPDGDTAGADNNTAPEDSHYDFFKAIFVMDDIGECY